MSRLIFALALFVALLGSFIGWTAYAAEDQQFYYIGRWEWYQEVDAKAQVTGFVYWRCPGGNCAGLIDLRSIPQMSMAGGTPEGYGFFVYEEPQLNPSLYYIGNSLNYPLNVSQKQWIEANLGLVQIITQSTILDVLYTDLLILNGDPTGLDRWKPLRGSLKTGVNLYLANELVKREELTQDHIVFQCTIEVFRADYTRLKAEGVSIEHLRKVIGGKMLSLYGRMGDDLLYPLLGVALEDAWDKPSTTITESFPGTSDTFGGDLSWTEVDGDWDNVSDEGALYTIGIAPSGGAADARADSDLSSADHYAQVALTALEHLAANHYTVAGAASRFSASAETFYTMEVYDPGGEGSKARRMEKVVAGTETVIAGPHDMSFSLPITLKSQANGTAIKGFIGAVEYYSITDSSISGNLRAGLFGFLDDQGTNNGLKLDNFEAADLAVETTVTNAYWY